MKQCQICQQTKAEQRPPAGLMGQRVIDGPWQVVAGDITGPFVKSKLGYEYILVFQDLFTRWVECVPIRRANAKTVLKEFKDRVVLRFGTPEVFLSDNGTEFKNKVVDEYLAGLGVHHSTTPPYHPQANPVERVNRTLKTRLIAFVEESHTEWDQKLPELMFSLNNSVHASTGVSPAALNYGRQPLPPATARREQEREALERREHEAIDDWTERLRDMESLRKRAAAQAADEQRRQAAYYNARRREVSYEVGDLVMKRNRILSSAAQGISAKLAPKYAGPLKVLEVTGPNTVRVIDEKDASEETLHVSHLKPYHEEGSEDSGEEVADVEDAQPPREVASVPVTSDPPEIGGAPPGDARPVEKRPRGTSAKNGPRRETNDSAKSARGDRSAGPSEKPPRSSERIHEATRA